MWREVTLFISFDQIFEQELSKICPFACFLSTRGGKTLTFEVLNWSFEV